MKAMNTICLILLFIFASTCRVKTCLAAYSKKHQDPGSSWKVTIINYQKNATLEVHCKSKDDDLGIRCLPPHFFFLFSFSSFDFNKYYNFEVN